MHHMWYFFFIAPPPHIAKASRPKANPPHATHPPDSISILLPTFFLLVIPEAPFPVTIPVPVWLGDGLAVVLVGVTFTTKFGNTS